MTSRRHFLQTASAAAILSPILLRGESDKLGKLLPQRVLGRTGEKVTAFGLGGYHVGVAREPKTAEGLTERAMERGIRFFDNAVNYQKSLSESYYGRFLCPKYRDHVFVTTKSSQATAKGARQEFEDSLRRLKTDRIDLWQLHAFTSVEDVKNRIQNGALDVFLEMRDKKLARYIGFTGHSSQAAHCYFLDHCEKEGIRMDTWLMPLNLVDPHYDSFVINMMPKLLKQGIAPLAMKTLVFGKIFARAKELDPSVITVKNLHEYACSLPISCMLSGCETVAQIDENTAILENFKGMDHERRMTLVASSEAISGRDLEYYENKA